LTNYSTYSDEQLLELLKNDDEAAFKQLYDRYSDSIFRAAMIYMKDIHLAQDIVQSLFLLVWDRRGSAYEIKSIKDFLFISARNKMINELQRKSKKLTITVDFSNQPFSDRPDGENASALEAKQTRRLILDAVEQLPSQQKKAFLMYTDGNYSYQDIAKSLQLSRFTIKRHLENARKSVRQYIQLNSNDLLGVFLLLLLL
jgi:RNA polymerase sigma-70 factor (family 1)